MSLIYPVLVQVLLTFVILGLTGRSRFLATKAGEVRVKDVALSGEAWPAKPRQFANNYANQFETPVLFYVLVGAALYTAAPAAILAPLAWLYVLTRIAHAYVHTGSNIVMLRFQIFLAGVAMLGLMWGVIAFHVILR
jgi:hypothetical protein